ncbi:unnamed protein product [Ectocarpus sp. 13 AM-2016]
MTTPLYVLKPISSGYKEVLLPPGTKFIGRSVATGIQSQVVSRKHIEVAVEGDVCKVRYCAKFKSEVKIDNALVKKEWVPFPVGGRLEFLTDPVEAFPYRLERYSTASSPTAAAEASGNTAAIACDQHQEITTRLACPMCYDLFVDPIELDCKGKHLYCHSCIYDLVKNESCQNKCPTCMTSISSSTRKKILQAGRKRGASGMPVGANKRYQSQAVGLVQEVIEWLIEKRMVKYDDETEWRKRSGLEPLPPPKPAAGSGSGGGGASGGGGGGVGGGRKSGLPVPFGNTGGAAGTRSAHGAIFSGGNMGGGAADVIDLLSDSPAEDDDDGYSDF